MEKGKLLIIIMSKKNFKIVTLCGDHLIAEAFKSIILAGGYDFYFAVDFDNLLERIESQNMNLVLIDEHILVNGQVQHYFKYFKKYNKDLPVLVAVDEGNKKFLKKDIFTYITKPINISIFKQVVDPYREISEKQALKAVKFGVHNYNVNSRTLELLSGDSIRFTNFESALIMIFLENLNKSLSAKFLTENILGYSSDSDSNTLKTHIWRLRKKLAKDEINFDIVSINEGYSLKKK